MATPTTSIRLHPQLRRQLDRYARQAGMTKTAVVEEVLRLFFSEQQKASLAKEIRRQSLLIAAAEPEEKLDWLDAMGDWDAVK